MARISLSGFKDPVTRPRFVVWTVVAAIIIVAVMVPVLGVTSTRWFCAEGCHKVQDDTITAYKHSSHSEISCMACHMPVNANPVVFLLHKAEALGELYMTVTNKFELPLNGEDEVALTMKSTQCTQCHDENKRHVTPSSGIKIDHAKHAEKGVDCTICHNRIAHREDFELQNKDPNTGTNRKHPDFMTMTACFRCHSQEPGSQAPGTCITCHPEDFQLKPDSHLQPGFFPKGHGKLGAEEESRTLQAAHYSWLNGVEESLTAAAEGNSHKEAAPETLGQSLPNVESINECSTCHQKRFCIDCHGGIPMPHPPGWTDRHGKLGKSKPQSCAKCHGQGTAACDSCHHGTQSNWNYNPDVPWRQQHPSAVNKSGAASCLEKCHNPTFCSNCHVNGGVPPK